MPETELSFEEAVSVRDEAPPAARPREKGARKQRQLISSSGKIIFSYPIFHDRKNFIVGKLKPTVQRVSSLVITAIFFFWILSDICSQLSIFQLEQRRILSSLLMLFSFTVFLCAMTTMIVVRAPFSRLQRTMLMFWAIVMLVRSPMSLTAPNILMLATLVIVWHVLEKQPPHKGL